MKGQGKIREKSGNFEVVISGNPELFVKNLPIRVYDMWTIHVVEETQRVHDVKMTSY